MDSWNLKGGQLKIMQQSEIEEIHHRALDVLLDGKPIFVDPAVFFEKMVDISSGDSRAGIELKSEDLQELLGRSVVTEITKKG